MKLTSFVGPGEKILYTGKPDKKVTILEGIFNRMLPLALIWGAFDFGIMGLFITQDEAFGEAGTFLILFMMLHLMPVWIYLGGIITAGLKYKNTEYMITTKGLYVATGILTYNYEMKPFTDLSHITIHQGFIDQILGTGDVITSCGHSSTTATSTGSISVHTTHTSGMNISNIRDYEKVFKMLRKLQEDIYADTMFPNQYRPGSNPGYQTSYANNDFLVDLDNDSLQAPIQENRYGNTANPYANNNNPYATAKCPYGNAPYPNSNGSYGSNPYQKNTNPYTNTPYATGNNAYGNQNYNSSVEIDTFTS